LGYHAIAHPDFVNGIVAVVIIFVSSSATSAMVPVISEMKNPAHYNRALFTAQGTINSSYLTFGLVVYAYCGKWVASPSLGVSDEYPCVVNYETPNDIYRVLALQSRRLPTALA
jgi:hypothetical protein